jgi:hypothetical protein
MHPMGQPLRFAPTAHGWAGPRPYPKLSVAQGNPQGHALYLRNGFTDEPGDLMPDGIHRELIMHKPL